MRRKAIGDRMGTKKYNRRNHRASKKLEGTCRKENNSKFITASLQLQSYGKTDLGRPRNRWKDWFNYPQKETWPKSLPWNKARNRHGSLFQTKSIRASHSWLRRVQNEMPWSPVEIYMPFWKNIVPPSSSSNCFFLVVACLTYSPTLKMEAVCSCEKSVNFHRTTRHHFPVETLLPFFLNILSSPLKASGYYTIYHLL
jgi:hypothetical protein